LVGYVIEYVFNVSKGIVLMSCLITRSTLGDFIFPLKPSFKLGFRPNFDLNLISIKSKVTTQSVLTLVKNHF